MSMGRLDFGVTRLVDGRGHRTAQPQKAEPSGEVEITCATGFATPNQPVALQSRFYNWPSAHVCARADSRVATVKTC